VTVLSIVMLTLVAAPSAHAQDQRLGQPSSTLKSGAGAPSGRSPFEIGIATFRGPRLTFSRPVDPRYSGERTIGAMAQGLPLDQDSPLDRLPSGGRVRVELEYRTDEESWSQGRRVVPAARALRAGRARGSRLEAVLPQTVTLADRSASDAPRWLSPDYSRRPVAFAAGDVVHYRWLVRSANGRVSREPARTFLMPRPFTVAMMGDSFGAGEGAPNVDKPTLLKPASSEHVPVGDIISSGAEGFEHFAVGGVAGRG